jgi:hypothetical protein
MYKAMDGAIALQHPWPEFVCSGSKCENLALSKCFPRRADLAGYGASIFSEWQNPQLKSTGIVKTHFETVVGRTRYEVVQAHTRLHPFSARLVHAHRRDIRPTPASPIAAVEEPQAVEQAAKYVEHEKSSERYSQATKLARTQARKQKTRRRWPADSYAYARSEQSFLRARRAWAATMRNNDRWTAREAWLVSSDSSRSRTAQGRF